MKIFLNKDEASTSKPISTPIASVASKTSESEPVTVQLKNDIVTIIEFCNANTTARTAIRSETIK